MSITNLQFKMTSLEHKALPLVFKKNTLPILMSTLYFNKQFSLSLSPWEFIKKNS
jgi:hypothetical protein